MLIVSISLVKNKTMGSDQKLIQSGSEVIKILFMLNSGEHAISNAHEYSKTCLIVLSKQPVLSKHLSSSHIRQIH